MEAKKPAHLPPMMTEEAVGYTGDAGMLVEWRVGMRSMFGVKSGGWWQKGFSCGVARMCDETNGAGKIISIQLTMMKYRAYRERSPRAISIGHGIGSMSEV
jgi:hypothetical protein